MESKLPAVARGEFQLDNRMLLYAHVLGHDGWEGHALKRRQSTQPSPAAGH